jgi:hypothetical protein
MKKFILGLALLLATSASYAQELTDRDFKLIGPSTLAAEVRQTKSRDEILQDIQRSLDNIQRQLDTIGNKVGAPAVKTEAEYKRFLEENKKLATPTPAQPQTHVTAPKTAPPTDNGPTWTYDPTTNSYFRYVPTTSAPRQQTRTVTSSPVYYRSSPAPVYYSTPRVTNPPVYYYRSAPAPTMGMGMGAVCPT